jgi:hypothetical protein
MLNPNSVSFGDTNSKQFSQEVLFKALNVIRHSKYGIKYFFNVTGTDSNDMAYFTQFRPDSYQ